MLLCKDWCLASCAAVSDSSSVLRVCCRRLIEKNRCVVVVDGFYEWHKFQEHGRQKKQPFFIRPTASAAPAGAGAGAGASSEAKNETATMAWSETDKGKELPPKVRAEHQAAEKVRLSVFICLFLIVVELGLKLVLCFMRRSLPSGRCCVWRGCGTGGARRGPRRSFTRSRS
jgi:hypothetical protein